LAGKVISVRAEVGVKRTGIEGRVREAVSVGFKEAALIAGDAGMEEQLVMRTNNRGKGSRRSDLSHLVLDPADAVHVMGVRGCTGWDILIIATTKQTCVTHIRFQ